MLQLKQTLTSMRDVFTLALLLLVASMPTQASTLAPYTEDAMQFLFNRYDWHSDIVGLLTIENASLATDLTGAIAPNFALPATDGRTVELHSLRGNIVLVSFWATWCPPCRRELPMLELIHQKLADRGAIVLGVNTEDEATARQYVEGKGYSFKTLVDATGEVQKMYGVEAIPTLLVLDRHSKVIAHFVGTPEPQALVEALINAGVKSSR
jgi:peroxiredoxin